MGFFVGSVVGGRFSDRTVKQYIVKRDGVRIPKDRLNSGLATLFIVLPISEVLYGWSLDKEFGGLALPIVAAFWIGAGLMGTFNSLNTYTAGKSRRTGGSILATRYHSGRALDESVLTCHRGLAKREGRCYLHQIHGAICFRSRVQCRRASAHRCDWRRLGIYVL